MYLGIDRICHGRTSALTETQAQHTQARPIGTCIRSSQSVQMLSSSIPERRTKSISPSLELGDIVCVWEKVLQDHNRAHQDRCSPSRSILNKAYVNPSSAAANRTTNFVSPLQAPRNSSRRQTKSMLHVGRPHQAYGVLTAGGRFPHRSGDHQAIIDRCSFRALENRPAEVPQAA